MKPSERDDGDVDQIGIKYERHVGSPTYWGGWPVYIGEYSDSLIPNALKNRLICECKPLIENKNKLDYRNCDLSNKMTLNNVQIQDIIEPHNVGTIAHPTSDSNNISDEIHPWIPTVFRLNKKTKKYEIVSDIVDLPRFNNNPLYNVIEQIFNTLSANIKKTLIKYPERGKSENDKLEPHLSYYDIVHEDVGGDVVEYNVIIKMSDYQFLDGINSSYGGGNFHSEGFEEENIYGVALYYFDISSNIVGGNLSFHDPTYKWRVSSSDTEVAIKDNMTVFFTNKEPYLHKVNEMNVDIHGQPKAHNIYHDKNGNKVFGTRKLLGFFLKENSNYTTENVTVNFQYKIMFIVSYLCRKLNVCVDRDVSDTIKLFVCGDMKYIKNKVDNYRRQRYEFGDEIRNNKDNLIQAARRADFGKCD